MKHQVNQHYYHGYVTANEKRLYLADISNLLQLSKMHPGCNKLMLYIAISEVQRRSVWDRIFIRIVTNVFKKNTNIELRDIFFKPNIGRDFSSFGRLTDRIMKESQNEDDYIFFQNRSGQGPFLNNWYTEFIEQFNKFENVAICGASINFNDYYKLSDRSDLPHVQTYAFISQIKYLKMIPSPFPGERETERTQVISKGEIGLSQFFLKKGIGITCMKRKDDLVLKDSREKSINKEKEQLLNQAFYHRYFFREKESVKIKRESIFTVIVAYLRYGIFSS